MKNTLSTPREVIMSNMIDRRQWRWWDTFSLSGKELPSQLAFFQVPMNQMEPWTGQRKTKRETNMWQGSQLPPPYCLLLERIGFHVTSSDSSDIDRFTQSCWIEFQLQGKIFYEGFLSRFPEGYGREEGKGFPAPHAGWDFANGPDQEPQAGYEVGKGWVYVPPLAQFKLTAFFPNVLPSLAPDFRVVATLDGPTDFPVK